MGMDNSYVSYVYKFISSYHYHFTFSVFGVKGLHVCIVRSLGLDNAFTLKNIYILSISIYFLSIQVSIFIFLSTYIFLMYSSKGLI